MGGDWLTVRDYLDESSPAVSDSPVVSINAELYIQLIIVYKDSLVRKLGTARFYRPASFVAVCNSLGLVY